MHCERCGKKLIYLYRDEKYGYYACHTMGCPMTKVETNHSKSSTP